MAVEGLWHQFGRVFFGLASIRAGTVHAQYLKTKMAEQLKALPLWVLIQCH